MDNLNLKIESIPVNAKSMSWDEFKKLNNINYDINVTFNYEGEQLKESTEQFCEDYWSNPDLITPTWGDSKTPYYKPEPYMQIHSED